MRAEIISVGTELLLGQIVDTNAAYLSGMLPEYGIELHYRVTVGDNAARLAQAIERALERADLVFTIGGLGPTQDDLTRETAARVVGDEMTLDQASADALRAFFAARGVEMPESNLKQAMVPRRGRVFVNPLGTAPGAAFETAGGRAVIILPGPPREFIAMVETCVAPYLRERAGDGSNIITSRILRIAGLGESSVEDKIKSLLGSTNPTVAPYAGAGEVHLRITAKGRKAKAVALIDEMDSRVVSALGDAVFGRDDQTLEKVVVGSLIERNLTLAVAESCTGGLIANRITDVSGCSATFLVGVVSYSNDAKRGLLGVDEQLIIDYGAVSEEVARAMAEGVRSVSGADVGLSVTGIAGPSGGTAEKGIGLVYTALSTAKMTLAQKYQFTGSRIDIKQRAAQAALDLLRRSALEP